MIIQKKEGKEQKKEDSWHFWSPCGSDIVINNLCVRHVTTALWVKRSYCPHFTNEGKLDLESKPSPSCWTNYDSQPTTQPLLCYVIIDRMGPVFSVTNSQTWSLPAITFCHSMYFKRFLSVTTAASGAKYFLISTETDWKENMYINTFSFSNLVSCVVLTNCTHPLF